MTAAESINFISSVGFPIVITLWFMTKTEKVIQKNTEAFEKISIIIENCKRK